MVYKLLPTGESITLVESINYDDWGIKQPERKIKLDCMIREVEESTQLESLGGRQTYLTYEISFNGATILSVGDMIEVSGQQYRVAEKKEYKDFNRSIIYTKIKV